MTTDKHALAHPYRAPLLFVFAASLLAGAATAQEPQVPEVPVLRLHKPFAPLPQYGPYNAHILAGGRGLTKALPTADPLLEARAPWTLSAWVEFASVSPASVLIAGVGDASAEDSRYFALSDGKPALQLGKTALLVSALPFHKGGWHFFAATSDGGVVRFYVDGAEAAHNELQVGMIAPLLVMGPVTAECSKLPCAHFGGYLAELTLGREALSGKTIAALAKERPDPELVTFEEGSKPWPLQVVQYAGNTAPQEPWTMPQRKAPFSKPHAALLPPEQTSLAPTSATGDWILRGGWKLAEAPSVAATSEAISAVGFDTAAWMPATVPGTVLTTMIDRGRYPDPDFGLDNLAIPEKLHQQDYWYRVEFATPHSEGSPHATLVFDGINYRAEVWFNGHLAGNITGAFTRGVFDVGPWLSADGRNAVAVRVTPVPHPGIPNVQSIAFGAGLNGGAMELDGPTFMASEGWDWNPPMHDRDTGIWQDVHLVLSGAVSIGDEQVITHLPLPDTTQADVLLNVPLGNSSGKAVSGVLTASFEGVEIHKQVSVPPGGMTVALASAEFPSLHLQHPRLWWPNGYGKPELYHLTTTFAAEGAVPVVKTLRFGVREVSYELSLLDNDGALRRVDYDPTVGRTESAPQVNVTHEGMRQVTGGWAASIADGKNNSPVFHAVDDTRATPFLILRVNGVRIAIRGGSWGMDDSRKRVSRERLEPYFRYDRDANLNTIRNWQGQDTEAVFYDLADEYGMLVWNDFWEVTTDSNAEAEDPQLFLANAHDTILRYRNHPSIVMWCGRNEGVPQPVINEGLITLTHTLDGTRYYSPSSNEVNLLPSGPYSYQEPSNYYNRIDQGFAVEVGTPSLPTLEWFDRWLPKEDRWPISDDWAYHNWHPHDEWNQHLEAQFGAAGSLEEFERQGQMLNYVSYRAIFEGFNAHLWAPNGGRLLWMTQPSWPSTLWAILTSDYDTQASYYATKKACEPMHIQLDLATNQVDVINTTLASMQGLKAQATIYALDGKVLQQNLATVAASTDDMAHAMQLNLAPLMGDTTVLVKLTLHAEDGTLLSQNLYWRAASDVGYRALNAMASAKVSLSVEETVAEQAGPGRTLRVRLKNTSGVPALNTKIATFNAATGAEILPAFYSDNYISLLPGEEQTVSIEMPAVASKIPLQLKMRGWNVIPASVSAGRTIR